MTDDTERTPPERSPRRRWFRLSQETIAIVTFGIAALAMIDGIRDDARADRAAWQAQAQAHHEAWERRIAEVDAAWKVESRQLRDEARANRDAWEAESRHFQNQILRLTTEQARLAARIDE